ncbi:MAG: ATP-binding protein [Dehalococcoidia bacterium]|nr:ATP-binding protein [Dehalococcoidia bacterium]
MVILTGLIGSGKTTLACELAVAGDLALISSDVTRKSLAGLPLEQHRYEELEQGIYSPEFSRRTYDVMFDQASSLLRNRRSVIIDASFRKAADRRKAYQIAREAGANLWVVECRAPEEVIRERLRRRREEASLSNATLEIFDDLKKAFEPVVGEPGNHLIVQTTRPVHEIARSVLQEIDRRAARL